MLVYLIQNKINRKVYIGQTTKSLHHRREHIASAKSRRSKRYLQNAIVKHGAENFEVQHLANASTKDELDNLEKVFIVLFRSKDKKYGYNLTGGGDGVLGFQPSNETRKKMSLARKAYRQSPETIAKAAAARCGQKRSEEIRIKFRLAQKNRPPISEETREKMRIAKLGKKRPPRSSDYCENIRRAKLGHPVSEEVRHKISESLKRYNREKI